MRVSVLLFVVVISGCASTLHAAMEDQIGMAEGCDDARVVEQRGNVARVHVCGGERTCRYSADVRSWVCEQP